MIKRENEGKMEWFDISQYSSAYSTLDDLAKLLNDMDVKADVPIRFVRVKIDQRLKAELVHFGCPEDLAGEIAYAYGSDWVSLES